VSTGGTALGSVEARHAALSRLLAAIIHEHEIKSMATIWLRTMQAINHYNSSIEPRTYCGLRTPAHRVVRVGHALSPGRSAEGRTV
jgi:hypothetical protein